MSSEARAATNDGSTPRARTASAVTGPTAATRGLGAHRAQTVAGRRDAVHAREDDPLVLLTRFSSAASSGRRSSAGRISMSGTIETSAPRLSRESASGFDSGPRHHDAPA